MVTWYVVLVCDALCCVLVTDDKDMFSVWKIGSIFTSLHTFQAAGYVNSAKCVFHALIEEGDFELITLPTIPTWDNYYE